MIALHCDGRLLMTPNDTCWTDESLDALREEFAGVYGGRTVLVTGADGFMGSHLTEALVALDATSTRSSGRRRVALSTTSGSSATASKCTSQTSPTRRRSTT